jgi:hypothetical protein
LSFCSICRIDKCYCSKIATFTTVTVVLYYISVVTVIGVTVIVVTAIVVIVTKVIDVVVNMFAFTTQLIR